MTTTDTDALNRRIRDEVYGTWISSCCDGAVINIDEAAEIAADLIPIVEAEVRKAKAEALREAVEEHAITIPDALGYKVPAVTVEDLLDTADEHESGGSDDR